MVHISNPATFFKPISKSFNKCFVIFFFRPAKEIAISCISNFTPRIISPKGIHTRNTKLTSAVRVSP